MFLLSSDEGRQLLELARQAITIVVTEKALPEFAPACGNLTLPAGAFVTLHRKGKLRGCVGQVEDPGPLSDTVVRAAINAALHDSRFFPVSEVELNTLEIDISVLSPLAPITPGEIVIGRHGLMAISAEQRGLLLPQVALERQWSNTRFLEETCLKAGLPREAWKSSATRILGFTVQAFSESRPRAASQG